jgi:hypothetical protein
LIAKRKGKWLSPSDKIKIIEYHLRRKESASAISKTLFMSYSTVRRVINEFENMHKTGISWFDFTRKRMYSDNRIKNAIIHFVGSTST